MIFKKESVSANSATSITLMGNKQYLIAFSNSFYSFPRIPSTSVASTRSNYLTRIIYLSLIITIKAITDEYATRS